MSRFNEVAAASVEVVNSAPAPLKYGPPAAVNALSLGGVPLDQWVYALTMIWLVLQICGWFYDRYKRKDKKNIEKDHG